MIARSPQAAPPWLAEVRALLVDLDGTLVDSDAAVERAWRRWVEEYGGGEKLEQIGMHGRPAELTVQLLDPTLDAGEVRERAQRQLTLQYEDREPLERCPGATELLATLERLRLPWAVVTSCDHRLADLRLDAIGVEPAVLVTSEDVEIGKPDPECFRRGAAQLGIRIERCLVVEDSEAGLVAGRRAGARTAALRGLEGDLAIDELGSLARLLAPA